MENLTFSNSKEIKEIISHLRETYGNHPIGLVVIPYDNWTEEEVKALSNVERVIVQNNEEMAHAVQQNIFHSFYGRLESCWYSSCPENTNELLSNCLSDCIAIMTLTRKTI